MSGQLQIRRMTEKDASIITAWGMAEGWNPGLSDAPLFYGLDPDGYFVGEIDWEPVAIVLAAAYDAAFAFIGSFIVRSDCRGGGYGRAIWSAALQHVGGRVLGLDAVLEQEPRYRRDGFETKHRTIRYAGVAAAGAMVEDDRWSGGGEAEIARFEARHLPAARDAFARAWLTEPTHRVRLVRIDGEIAGYGVVRPSHDGFRIGPLYASTPNVAARLFAGLVADLDGSARIAIDVPEPNGAGSALAERHGLRPAFETVRMYRGQAPELPLGDIYGLTSFEVG